ncbi:PREDICTED: F-box/LRR-repeat [Prunus dulcis]|uniref:PREDICTED: F-box/LRR-repeat n=1 Tax=Prunus dulcis TaxID=3755 RepID=A0A5E4ER01_PRUDU|nr:PREDICTED: F-box/LRR-repeat [Prunus dulcis]
MVSIFEGMCNLSTLEIMSDPEFFEPKTDCSGFNMGYCRLQNIYFIHQLKEVTIELSIGSNGIQFAKYVLEHAQNLKKITVFHSPQQSKAVTIESSSLKSFSFVHSTVSCGLILSISGEKLEDILIDSDFLSTCKNLLNIFAPKYLKWSGDVLIHQVIFGKFMCIEKAELFLMPEADDVKILSEVLCRENRVEACSKQRDYVPCVVVLIWDIADCKTFRARGFCRPLGPGRDKMVSDYRD